MEGITAQRQRQAGHRRDRDKRDLVREAMHHIDDEGVRGLLVQCGPRYVGNLDIAQPVGAVHMVRRRPRLTHKRMRGAFRHRGVDAEDLAEIE
jgi:hypothetical protein